MSKKKKLVPITDASKVPNKASEEEEIEFWSRHSATQEYLDSSETSTTKSSRPQRSRAISVRFDEKLLRRLKRIADEEGKRYQTLLKEFVTERIEQEEEKLGLAEEKKLKEEPQGIAEGSRKPRVWVEHLRSVSKNLGGVILVPGAAPGTAFTSFGVEEEVIPEGFVIAAHVAEDAEQGGELHFDVEQFVESQDPLLQSLRGADPPLGGF
jgi:predicted DNA binding CopG/RHH family protein